MADWTTADYHRYKDQVVSAYGWLCHLCRKPIDPAMKGKQGLSLDHVLPRSQGGQNTIENLRPSHLLCNSRRGDRPIEEYLLTEQDKTDWFFGLPN
ncbi:HNH endonuclease [Glutamicibacter arilaitensis]|nr:HNH endonuclease signature motif containing protein [Glutamicibacter arilaitensis]